MQKCPKCSCELKEHLTKSGILIDMCISCKAVWLDEGELDFFCKNHKLLSAYNKTGLQHSTAGQLNCPKCEDTKLNEGKLPNFFYFVEECQSCKGLLLDFKELKKLNSSKYFKSFATDSKIPQGNEVKVPSSETSITKSTVIAPIIKLKSLGIMSFAVLGSMYAVLFGFVVFMVEAGYIRDDLAIPTFLLSIFLQFLFGPWIMDWSLKLFGSLSWKSKDNLPEPFGTNLNRLCKENKIPYPKVGIINDGSPQAYTYGRTPWSARLVLSKGIFDLLDDDEIEAVTAHELAHIKHWDFVVMTIASLVPIIFYQIYRNARKFSSVKSSSKDGSKAKIVFITAAAVAYLFYMISEYLVMFISRLREYHADRFSAYATKKPNALLTALTKVALGLAPTGSNNKIDNDKDSNIKKQKRMAIQSMGIMNTAGSKQLLLAKQGNSGNTLDPRDIKDVMRWDLWSPWAAYYELHSTHPLPAKRIHALSTYAISMNQTPYVTFDLKKPESYWDDFFVDLLILSLPAILGVGFVTFRYFSLGIDLNNFELAQFFIPLIIGLSIGGIIKTMKVYPNESFRKYSISSLLKKIKVSPVRSSPVTIHGHVIGRGDAGNIFSEDMVIQDKTGLIYLDHEPFGFNFFFALFKIDKFKGQDVVVEGWYRRAPVPYIEVKRIKSKKAESSSYTYYIKLAIWVTVLISTIVISR